LLYLPGNEVDKTVKVFGARQSANGAIGIVARQTWIQEKL
jgi:hypothetical protein